MLVGTHVRNGLRVSPISKVAPTHNRNMGVNNRGGAVAKAVHITPGASVIVCVRPPALPGSRTLFLAAAGAFPPRRVIRYTVRRDLPYCFADPRR